MVSTPPSFSFCRMSASPAADDALETDASFSDRERRDALRVLIELQLGTL